jgi:hypothetical protein
MATSTDAGPRQGEPFHHHGVAVRFAPTLFDIFYLAALDTGFTRATCRTQDAGAAIADGDAAGQDAGPPIAFFAGHYPESF